MFYKLFYFDGVKGKANDMNTKNQKETTGRNHGAHFTAVTDSRNRKIRGLWVRGGRYYAQFRMPGEKSARKEPLTKKEGGDSVPVENYSEAIAARDELLHSRRHGKPMSPKGRKPLLNDAVAEYIRHHRSLAQKDEDRRTEKSRTKVERGAVEDQDDAPKKLTTVRKEELILALWSAHIGNIALDRITKGHVTSYLENILEAGKKKRTRNIHLSILRNLLNHFADKGIISHDFPTAGVKLLKHKTPKREFLSTDQLNTLVSAALLTKDDKEENPVYRNGQSLADLIRLLAFSGAREMETLRLHWEDVDFSNRILHIGRDGKTKNRESRTVDFNPDLEALLLDMKTRRAPDSPWIFPSPKRGTAEEHDCWQNPHKVWYSARTKAKLDHVRLHDLRHYFASRCVMAGIDYMTIAAWLGHLDGGILVGKVYGHLADEHKKRQADKLTLSGPRIIALPKPEPTASETAAATA